MLDFLVFKNFISTEVLIIFYYFGAVVVPFLLWILIFKKFKIPLWKSLKLKHKIVFILLVFMSFMFMQLIWRMMFEFLIAYMQMREAIIK